MQGQVTVKVRIDIGSIDVCLACEATKFEPEGVEIYQTNIHYR